MRHNRSPVTRDRTPIPEKLLIEALKGERVSAALCVSLGRGQLAAEISSRWPAAQVLCHFLDLYRAQRAEESLGSQEVEVEVICTSDFPEQPFDLVAIPCTARGDGELTRDLLQTGFERLEMGGKLLVASDNPRDTWLGEVLERFMKKVTREQSRKGVVYSGIKTAPLRKVKDYSCQFAFRDQERLIQAFSRPGVFSHRRLDLGSRALLESMEIRPGMRVLDIGCGAGVVSLAAASRADGVKTTAVDANPRAIECTQRGAELNGLTSIQTLFNADAVCEEPRTYDLALANPPYFSNYRIGEIFVNGAKNALRPGGTILLVTKQPEPYLALVRDGFHEATVNIVRQYSVVRAIAD